MTQPSLWHVLQPKWRTTLQRLREERERGGHRKLLLLSIVGALFWLGVFGVLYKILKYFRGVEELGPLLAGKLLGLALLSFISILILSNVITALSSFFLAKDLDLLVSAPVDWLRLYLAKLGETLLHSSWMVALMAVPILAAYGVIYQGGLLFIPYAVLAIVPMLVLPAVVGSAITLVLVNLFPARRTRDLLSIVALGAAGGVILLFRIIRPEQLARPEGFRNLLDFITVLRTPTSPFLPSEWATKAIMGYLRHSFDPLPLVLLWTTAAGFITLGAMLHRELFAQGFTKAQEGAERFVRGAFWRWTIGGVLRPLPVAKREFVLKDIKLFFRDTTQWSQLILLGVLVVVYLFNIKALPLFSGEQVPFFYVTLVSFLNLGLSGFVLASIAARFIFPAVSLEGRQMWLLRSSPLDLRALLWSKYWVGTIPLLVLALLLTGLTNVLLKVSPFMMVVSLTTIFALTLAIAALALGFGALYPQFETENAAQIPTSFGGLVFMMATIALLAAVILCLAGPVYAYLRAANAGEPVRIDALTIAAFTAAAAICTAATVIPLRLGLKKMESFEF
jgi:ABC-2 type transport system permease protein